jgi:FKBP-type peptidyl-prolyl cis-trans isomerase
MKIASSLTAGLIACALVAAARAQDLKLPATVAGPAAAPAVPAATFTDAQLAEEFGWFMAKRVGIADLQFTPAETEALVRGIATAVAGKESPYELQAVGPQMDAFMQRKQSVYLAKLKTQSAEQAAAFFAKLKDNKAVIELPSGLRYEVKKAGSGAMPKSTDTVTVNYTGKLIDGTVFDSSLQPRQPGATPAPATFPLDGPNSVIDGWKEGLQKVAKGGSITLYVPANLAYGDDGRAGIPPGSTLIFDIDLIDIQPTPAASSASATGMQLSMPAAK